MSLNECVNPTENLESKSKPLTVSEFTHQIRAHLEPAFSDVWITGEVSNYRPATSGHAYFSLKDEGATIAAVSFGWLRKKVSFKLEDGLKVLCHGRISVYPPRGNYQITVDQIEPLGLGALQLKFEQLKQKLSMEGLFDPAHKKPLPRYPHKMVIITSPTGAAIQDILNVLGRRAPWVHVLVIPVLVQGEDAPAQMIRAIELANRQKLGDVILLTRGGGSIEDLWCFNDEGLARAIYQSEIPIVSAVGHEIDFTISDFVSDLRAPTPSAGAEIITSQWVALSEHLKQLNNRLFTMISHQLQRSKMLLLQWTGRLRDPKTKLKEQSQRIDELLDRLIRAQVFRLTRAKQDWMRWSELLDSFSPLKVLERGYSIVRKLGSEEIIYSKSDVQSEEVVQIVFLDGTREARII
jgi:exodeoxyribonuclease VII large subunit